MLTQQYRLSDLTNELNFSFCFIHEDYMLFCNRAYYLRLLARGGDMSNVKVFDLRSRIYRDNDPDIDDDTIGFILFKPQAIQELTKYYVVCGHTIIGKSKQLQYPIDIHKNYFILLESTFNYFPLELKDSLIEFNISGIEAPFWSKFFAEWVILGDWDCFTNNGTFIEMCSILTQNERIVSQMIAENLSLIHPFTYDELCDFTRFSIYLTGTDYINTEYVEEFKYLIDALVHHYRINYSDSEIELYTHQVSTIIIKQMEE